MTRSVLLTALLTSAALIAPLSQAAAQTAKDGAAPTSTRTTVEEVVIYSTARKTTGGGLIKPQIATKSISTVSSAYIKTQPAIQNAYQYVALTPGAMVSMTDPYGLNEQFSLNVHGLGQDELGYTLEGMPLNDIGFYTAYPEQFIDSENMDEISLAQGSADLDSPVISAAGGLMTITMLDPSLRPGGLVDLSYGSYDADREFIRLDSGLIGDTGVRAFVSYSHTKADNWHGPGTGFRHHVDFKFVREWGENRITLSGEYHNGFTPLYIEPTLTNYQKYGTGGPNNYDNTFTPGDTNYYKLHTGTFRVVYLSGPSHFKLSDDLTYNVTPYWQYGYGNGPYGATLDEGNDTVYGNPDSPGGRPITGDPNSFYTLNIPNFAANGGTVMANYTDLQYRAGVINKLTYTVGPNSFIAGFWYDWSDETDTQSFNAVDASGNPADYWGESSAGLVTINNPGLPYNGAPYTAGADRVVTNTIEGFVGDTAHLLDDKLTIEAGFKYAFVDRKGTNETPDPMPKIKIDDYESLPRVAARYKIDESNSVFANVSTNFRTPSELTLFAGWFDGYEYFVPNANLKPEYSISEDIGYRYQGSLLTGSITFFNYNFTNRQISTQSPLNPGANESINAGNQTTRGVDIEGGLRPWHHISPYASAEYLHSTEDSNLFAGTSDGGPLGTNGNHAIYLPTAGKTSVRSPKYQAALGLSYDDGNFFGNFSVKYVDAQYGTFMNDEGIPSYITTNLAVGARLPSIGLRGRPEVKLNLINLGGASYLSAAANPGATAGSTTYYLAGGFAARFTATQAF